MFPAQLSQIHLSLSQLTCSKLSVAPSLSWLTYSSSLTRKQIPSCWRRDVCTSVYHFIYLFIYLLLFIHLSFAAHIELCHTHDSQNKLRKIDEVSSSKSSWCMTSHNGACLEDGFSKLMFFFFMVAFIFHFAASKPWLNDRFQPWATDDLLLNMPKWRRPWVVTCDTRYNFMMVIRGVRAASSTSFPPPQCFSSQLAFRAGSTTGIFLCYPDCFPFENYP